MHFSHIVAFALPVLGAFAAPQPQISCTSQLDSGYDLCYNITTPAINGVTTTTLSMVLTITTTYTAPGPAAPTTTPVSSITTLVSSTTTPVAANTSTTSASSTSSTPAYPTLPYSLISARSGSPVHLLPFSAAGFRFWLGGNTASYCPQQVVNMGSCPAGNITTFAGTCAMDVEVPGGQQLYVTSGGEIGYTQAHSESVPQGANICPFTWSKQPGSAFATVSVDPQTAFGAIGFMACPTDSGYYQVFANVANATVPQGDASKCLGIDALANDFAGGFSAWQYT